jgi:carboxyvinyl-carboxyphosphonate phosphorylmutase
MRAAISARTDATMAIFARTSALVVSGMADMLERIRAYKQAGVDGIFLLGVKTPQQLDEIVAAAPVPIILGNAAPELRNLGFLGSKGVRICMQGHASIRAVIRALYESMTASRSDGSPRAASMLSVDELIQRVTRDDDYRRWSKDFLASDFVRRE